MKKKMKRWGGENDRCDKYGRNEDRPRERTEHVTECCAYEEERNKFNEKIENNIGKDEMVKVKSRK